MERKDKGKENVMKDGTEMSDKRNRRQEEKKRKEKYIKC